MKVARAKKKFEPITITIESLDEAHTLWHWLNMDYEQTGREYAKEVGIPEHDPKTIERLFFMVDKALGKDVPY